MKNLFTYKIIPISTKFTIKEIGLQLNLGDFEKKFLIFENFQKWFYIICSISKY